MTTVTPRVKIMETEAATLKDFRRCYAENPDFFRQRGVETAEALVAAVCGRFGRTGAVLRSAGDYREIRFAPGFCVDRVTGDIRGYSVTCQSEDTVAKMLGASYRTGVALLYACKTQRDNEVISADCMRALGDNLHVYGAWDPAAATQFAEDQSATLLKDSWLEHVRFLLLRVVVPEAVTRAWADAPCSAFARLPPQFLSRMDAEVATFFSMLNSGDRSVPQRVWYVEYNCVRAGGAGLVAYNACYPNEGQQQMQVVLQRPAGDACLYASTTFNASDLARATDGDEQIEAVQRMVAMRLPRCPLGVLDAPVANMDSAPYAGPQMPKREAEFIDVRHNMWTPRGEQTRDSVSNARRFEKTLRPAVVAGGLLPNATPTVLQCTERLAVLPARFPRIGGRLPTARMLIDHHVRAGASVIVVPDNDLPLVIELLQRVLEGKAAGQPPAISDLLVNCRREGGGGGGGGAAAGEGGEAGEGQNEMHFPLALFDYMKAEGAAGVVRK